jgi:Rieske Fe-S protein
MLICDLILGKNNPWEELYKPSRKTLLATPEFADENANTLWQYKDWLEPGDENQVDLLQPGEGIVVRKGLKKLAVSKDEHGKIHTCNAYCPHLGACLRWNAAEKTWDCPAHGSRFDCTGKELNGPTAMDLYEA